MRHPSIPSDLALRELWVQVGHLEHLRDAAPGAFSSDDLAAVRERYRQRLESLRRDIDEELAGLGGGWPAREVGEGDVLPQANGG